MPRGRKPARATGRRTRRSLAPASARKPPAQSRPAVSSFSSWRRRIRQKQKGGRSRPSNRNRARLLEAEHRADAEDAYVGSAIAGIRVFLPLAAKGYGRAEVVAHADAVGQVEPAFILAEALHLAPREAE